MIGTPPPLEYNCNIEMISFMLLQEKDSNLIEEEIFFCIHRNGKGNEARLINGGEYI